MMRIPLPGADRTRALLLVIVTALAVHSPSLWNSYAYDDVALIPRDQRVHSLKNVPKIFSTNYWNDASQAIYRPLVTTSFAVDWAVAPNKPGWAHFMNILWNAAACALLLLVLAELFPLGGALAGALIFAVHPVHVEAVANVVGRAELMAATFGFAASLIWMRSTSRKMLLGVMPALFALALFSKESAIMLAPLFVLLDIGTGRLTRGNVVRWLRGRATHIAALTAAAIAFLAARALVLDNLAPTNLDAALEVAAHGLPRLLTALQVWPKYLELLVVPRTLLADYGPRVIMPAKALTASAALGIAIVLVTIVGGCLAAWRGHGRTATALLWFPIAILPVSNLLFPIGVLVAERTLYMPSVALVFGIAALVTYVTRDGIQRRVRLAWAAVFVIASIFTVRTIVRIPDWRNTRTVFDAQARDRPDSFRVQWHAARTAAYAKRPQDALAAYGRALDLWPYRKRLLRESTRYAVQARDLKFARRIGEHAVTVWPDDADFQRSLAGIVLDMNDTTAALRHIERGLALAPGDSVLVAMRAAIAAGRSQ